MNPVGLAKRRTVTVVGSAKPVKRNFDAAEIPVLVVVTMSAPTDISGTFT